MPFQWNADGHANANAGNPDSYSYCDSDGYRYNHAQCYGNSYSYSDCKADANRPACRNAETTSHASAAPGVKSLLPIIRGTRATISQREM
jgi:hypothetical protein